VPAGSLRAKGVTIDFAVYPLSHPGKAPLELARSLAKAAGLQVVDATPTVPPPRPIGFVASPKLADMPPPGLKLLRLRGRGLSKSDEVRLQHPDSLTMLAFMAPRSP
jgi:hypothetical protein